VFYYRIHSPVILIEFDHQARIAPHRTTTPTREHIHTVVRTPNGNDYGKDLLRQHHENHRHGAAPGPGTAVIAAPFVLFLLGVCAARGTQGTSPRAHDRRRLRRNRP
jgi:hypothetical protein